ncbi:hypothetical protein DET61_1397 [Marinobacter nauticus]|uniref:Uncharacterized protein n=1 Tax=Marinobacter nauticus TaxID=2743 RepID=A0A368X6A9_MARNT|nr:hypothetical protein [Marinobacter nauticus]RCW61937.1 hypothetical protein DET61_1397 [Marinobacter nauticus]
MTNEIQLPKYSESLKLIAKIACTIGCIAGPGMMMNGLMSFSFGLIPGVIAVLPGWFVILGSVASMALCHSFLATVQAQIETKNAMVKVKHALSKINPDA